MEDLVLFGVGSDGSGLQWDGGRAPKGIMLRWLQAPNLPFPENGYELERAPVPDLVGLDWAFHVPEIRGATSFTFHDGAAVLSSDQPMSLSNLGGGTSLVVSPGANISVRFVGPAWWTLVRGRPTGGSLMIQGLAGGVIKTSAHFLPGVPVEWRSRGLDEIRIAGDGFLEGIQYQPLDVKRSWGHVAHLCLPVLDPRYACAPTGASDEAIASSRVPTTVDWAGRYSPTFPQLDAILVAMATKTPLPGTGATVANPSTTTLPPSATIDPAGAVQLAMLDAHLARAVGVLYDDDLAPAGLDGRAWAYRVTGSWTGPRQRIRLTAAGLRAAGLTLVVDGHAFRPAGRRRADSVPVIATATIDASKARPGITTLRVDAKVKGKTIWQMTDVDGRRQTGVWRSEAPAELSPRSGRPIAEVTISSTAAFVLGGLAVPGPSVERSSILPWVVATGAPPPSGPSSLTVDIDTPGGGGTPPRASIRWDTTAGVDPFTGGTVTYQVAADQLSRDPLAPAPAAQVVTQQMLLDNDAAILVPPDTVTSGGPMTIDRPLPEGWRAWWVRGVDLFGRVSAPTGPEIRVIVDSALPPPPVILAAEYAQVGLNAQLATLLGRSSAGQAWVDAQPVDAPQSAAIVTFGWTPELDAQCPDVDAFRVYARTPAADGSWSGRLWGTPIAVLGSFAVRFGGTVGAIGPELASVAVTAVEPLDDSRARCSTDLSVDVAGGLTGTELVIGASAHPVTSHGEGDHVVLVVTHPSGAPPVVGPATLRAGASTVRSITTSVAAPALSSNPHRRRVAGVLVAGMDRFVVVAEYCGTFLAHPIGSATWPAAGAAATWFPAYRVAVADTGFGPQASTTVPDAVAQLAVTSVRRSTLRPAESSPCLPATVHAVDVTPPLPPTLPIIPAGEKCAQLASAADWHGVSRFTLTWNAAAGASGYHVHRAMDEAVRLADIAAHGVGAGSVGHSFPAVSLPTDAGRKAAVLADLAAVDAALLRGDDAEVRATYRAMRADAWQLVAGQNAVQTAFGLLNGVPIDASTTSLEDRFDGVADAHWFYRVSSRNAGGLTSELSPSTPPICAPRTTPPRPPRGLLALAGDASVTLRFSASPSANIAHYRVYRSHDRQLAQDVRDMLQQARLAPTPTSTPAAGDVLPAADGSAMRWSDSAATPGREWFYRIVAEDTWGNRSEPSAVLSAHSLFPVPKPPVWNAPARGPSTVSLSWTHTDARMASRIERRAPGGMWREITGGWLPRGQYQFDDSPPDITAAWEYRLIVRDHADQIPPVQPVITIAEIAP